MTFSDVLLGAATERTLREVLREVRAGSVLKAHGLRPRQRLLFVGPPGCGKSVTTEALAYDLGWPLAKVNLATVVSSYLGETARNLQAIFEYGRAVALVLLFEELDAFAKERGDRSDHGEFKRVVATFLQLLDEFTGTSVLVATTNHPQLVDAAAWRRFDEICAFPPPTADELPDLIALKLRTMKMHFDAHAIARTMVGLTQADVEAVCHQAMRVAVLDGRDFVETADIAGSLTRLEERKRTVHASH